jgi:hypothetical protein
VTSFFDWIDDSTAAYVCHTCRTSGHAQGARMVEGLRKQAERCKARGHYVTAANLRDEPSREPAGRTGAS